MKSHCLCGNLEIVAPDETDVALCHCSMCRRWSGGPMFAVHCGSDVQLTGDGLVTYRSSDWAERGFCGRCGTHLFYHLLASNEYILPAGLFQDQAFALTHEIFIDERPPFYGLANDTRKLTGAQVFEAFSQD